jgi:FkbM family methyltransferase
MPASHHRSAIIHSLKAAAIGGGARLGMTGVRYFNRVGLAANLRQLFRQLAVNCVLDVGAHEGEYAHFLRSSVGYRGRIVSFEPSPKSFEAMASQFANDPNWIGQQYALGSLDAQAELHVLQNSVFNSFLLPTHDAEERFTAEVESEDDIVVPVHRLDDRFDLCVESIAHPHVFLKMDTQGFDLEVFKGAADHLSAVIGLQSELSLVPLYQGMPDHLESLAEYGSGGYSLSGVYSVNRDAGGLRLLEVDAVFVRSQAGV